MSTESVLITATLDAHEGRNVRICDIPGAFLSEDMDEDVKMALCGRLAERMVNIAPQIYRQKVTHEKGRRVIYVTLKKALYGFPRLEFLFYEQIVAEMRGKGVELNPYDQCVENKMIGVNKMTVYWHVGDLKVSHVDPKEVTNFLEWLEGIYIEVRTTRGKVHKYLGTTLDLRNLGYLQVTMVDYLKGVLEGFLEVITGRSTITTANHMLA